MVPVTAPAPAPQRKRGSRGDKYPWFFSPPGLLLTEPKPKPGIQSLEILKSVTSASDDGGGGDGNDNSRSSHLLSHLDMTSSVLISLHTHSFTQPTPTRWALSLLHRWWGPDLKKSSVTCLWVQKKETPTPKLWKQWSKMYVEGLYKCQASYKGQRDK